MNQIKAPCAGIRAGSGIVTIALVCAAIGILPPSLAWSGPARPAGSSRWIDRQVHRPGPRLAAEPATTPPEDETNTDNDDKDVPTGQVDKYIKVYEAMQKDHNLTVEQAASKQGLTVAEFRQLEGKIERDDMLRERVRKALRHATNPNEKDTSDE